MKKIKINLSFSLLVISLLSLLSLTSCEKEYFLSATSTVPQTIKIGSGVVCKITLYGRGGTIDMLDGQLYNLSYRFGESYSKLSEVPDYTPGGFSYSDRSEFYDGTAFIMSSDGLTADYKVLFLFEDNKLVIKRGYAY